MLHGRDGETAALGALLGGARQGRSGALVLRGEAGIGKSALLAHAVAAAGDMAVIRSSGVEFEAELPYAGLQLLLRTAMGSLDALPGPQRRALRTAFGLASDGAAEPMFVGLAVLSLLSDHAGERGLLCVVDDAQWLDRASVDALAFAARRLDAEGVVMLFAARDGEGAFTAPGLPELRLDALDPGAAATLLAERGGDLADGARSQVLAEAQGNPLALLELPLALRGGQGPGGGPGTSAGSAGPGALPLTSRLQLAFHGQVSHLPRGTQTLLLVAAADHTGDPGILVRAAETLGVGVDDLPPAEAAGLVFVDEEDRLRFRHPLVRAAIHQRAPLPERLAAHRALAGACDPVLDPDHRAWHLAAAATGPDEEVAAALQETAGRARERSGHAAAAAAFERAARLSTDPAARAERLVLAAESASEAGGIDRARGFAQQAARAVAAASGSVSARPAVPAGADAALLARTLHVQGLADFWEGDFPAAHRLLTEAAELAGPVDPAGAARMLVQAAHTAWYLGGAEVDDTLSRLAALELPAGAAIRPVAEFVVGALGRDAGQDPPPAVDAAAAAARAAREGRVDPRDLVMLCGVGLTLGQDAEAHALTTVLTAESRESGGVGRLSTLMFFRAEAEIFESRFDDAHRTASEGLRISRDTGQGQWVSQLSSTLAYVAAVRGDAAECRARVDEALAAGSGSATAPGAPWTSWSLGVLDLGQGRAQAALDRLLLLTDPAVRHQICATRSVPDLVEAAVRLGVPERADEAFTRFERWAARSRQDWAAALVARCRALLAPDGEAEAHWATALKAHDPHRRAMESARTELLFGEWLRRARRKSEARGRLQSALDVFERLGARPWADRARAELGAAGGSVTAAPRARSVADEAGLTPQESQIVRLAAQGLSNKDIAAQLFLSPRTVGYHLYKAYPKLGVVSRGELAGILG
ncbi:AAA family ATPase [Actinacidiphila acidipaludis]|uniref:AAA family ATPase n=1 Tax=Actinacidiphila acidipaludis TaxID=2873382 RepID=A0ABS7QCZ9_9ACTN|nr:LuxR family transcriptional regulator [Streptomyces acidipaludis]MBY8881036.1 AAA family ATPase [Streptomyces acidipaludis]